MSGPAAIKSSTNSGRIVVATGQIRTRPARSGRDQPIPARSAGPDRRSGRLPGAGKAVARAGTGDGNWLGATGSSNQRQELDGGDRIRRNFTRIEPKKTQAWRRKQLMTVGAADNQSEIDHDADGAGQNRRRRPKNARVARAGTLT
jgi:hypothetical protein